MTTENEKTQEQQTAEQAEVEAAFLAGATETPEKAVEPEKKEAKTEVKAETKPKEAKPKEKEAPVKTAAPDPWEGVQPAVRRTLEEISSKIANTENLAKAAVGRVGALQAAMDAAKAASKTGADAPTKEQIAAAAANTEKWKKLKDDFPEWADAMEERFTAEKAQLEAAIKAIPPAVDVAGLKKDVTGGVQKALNEGLDAAEERAFLRLKHPNWKQMVKTPEFSAWLNAQPDNVQRLADSPYADDAIQVFDSYEEHQGTSKATAEAATAEKEKENKDRLAAAVQPKSSTRAAPATVTEEDAFVQGFNNALGG